MKKHHNLKLIIPFKENDLFSITNYKKRHLDNFTNSFFDTQYKPYNNKYPIIPFNEYNKKKLRLTLKEAKTVEYKTNNNLSNNITQKLIQVPFPSFPNKKQIPALYKNSIKLVKYPKVQRDNFTLYNYNSYNNSKNKENEKFFNTFSEMKMNAETQTNLSKKNKTQYKGGNNLVNLNISPIRKEAKVKHNYKLYKFENKERVKHVAKKKFNINNFENILNKIFRLIEIKDEHNKGIKYTEVTNLLLDEIYNLIEIGKRSQKNNIIRKRFKTISTSISNKYFKEIKNKLDLNNNIKKEFLRKKIRFKTFIPRMWDFPSKFSFDPNLVNKVEDKAYNDYENNLEREEISNNEENINNLENIKKNKNDNGIFEIDDDIDSDSPLQTMKSKYNLFNLMMEKRGTQRRNENSNINFYNKKNGDNNIYNNKNNSNTFYNNNRNNNYNDIFGKNTNFINQNTRFGKYKRVNQSTQLNVLNLLSELSSKIQNKEESRKNEIENQRNIEQKNKKAKNNYINNGKRELKGKSDSEQIEYENYFKSEKLINLIKQFIQLDNTGEEYPDNYFSENDSDNEDILNNNSIIDENENKNKLNTLDDNVKNPEEDLDKRKNKKFGKIKRKKRRAETSIIKKIDFGIEIIKNICDEINLDEKDKEDLFNIFDNIKKITTKKELSKDEIKIEKKVLKTINDFIRKYLTDLPKLSITKGKSRNLLSNYFKNNLNFKLEEILYMISENNSIASLEKTPKKKNKKRPKNIQKKRLIFDNSYFFKKKKKKEIPLKDITLPKKDESSEEKNKQNNYSRFPFNFLNKSKEKIMKRRNAIFKIEKRREGLLRILPSSEIILTEEEKIIEKENLLDRRLKAFFAEIKKLKQINSNNNSDQLNSLIDKEMEKIEYVKDKTIEGRKFNFYENLKNKTSKIENQRDKDKKFSDNKRYIFFQSPVIFNIHKDKK